MELIFGAKALQSRSKRASAGACSNFVREIEGESFTLTGRPGYTEKVEAGNGPIRGMIEARDKLYVVSNKDFYEIDANWAATDKGDLETTAGRVSMSFDGNYIQIVDGVEVYTYKVADGTFAKNTDTDIISNPSHTSLLHGFHFINNSEDGTIATHESPNAPNGNWNALDFSTFADAKDRLISHLENRDEIFMFGHRSFQIWEYDANSSALPLKPIAAATGEVGIAAPYSAIEFDNTVVWLARDKHGQGVFVRADGWTPEVISTQELHTEWASYTTLTDAFTQVWWIEGHPILILTFPTADKSWAYDASNQGWAEFNRYNADVTKRGRHRANASVLFGENIFCGDYVNGKIYEVSFDTYSDDGTTILSTAESQKVWSRGRRLRHSRIELMFERGVGLTDDANQGYDPKVRLEYSNDNGNSWHDKGWKSIGKKGDYKARVFWTRLGSAYERIYRISVSDPVEWILATAELDVA